MSVLIAPSQGTGPYPLLAADLVFTACDVTVGNHFVPTGYDLLVVKGVGQFTVKGEPDIEGRDADDTTLTVAAGNRYFKLFNSTVGYNGPQGIHITGSAATLEYAVVRL